VWQQVDPLRTVLWRSCGTEKLRWRCCPLYLTSVIFSVSYARHAGLNGYCKFTARTSSENRDSMVVENKGYSAMTSSSSSVSSNCMITGEETKFKLLVLQPAVYDLENDKISPRRPHQL
jgi:hypothetical protein